MILILVNILIIGLVLMQKSIWCLWSQSWYYLLTDNGNEKDSKLLSFIVNIIKCYVLIIVVVK